MRNSLKASLFPLLLVLFLGTAFSAYGEEPLSVPTYPDSPFLHARSAILIDATTGETLLEKNADLVIPPASLTKLMTIHLAYKAADAGTVSMDGLVPIFAQDCAPELPYRSSLMFLQAGMRVSLRELLTGLAVPSGNDAAFAVARYISGSIENFALDMNREAASLGLEKTHFVEPSGISEENATTAREFSAFCRFYLRAHPEALRELHSLPLLRFPLLSNMPSGYSGGERAIEQKNRNGLLFSYPGCDGIKTGFIEESGYNIALTAQRDGTRFIAVILGGYGATTASGTSTREENGKMLLDYGFGHFITMRPKLVSLKPMRIWKGSKKSLELEPGEELAFTALKEEAPSIAYSVERDLEAIAPIKKGQKMGELVFSASGRIVKRVSLVAKEEIKPANPFLRFWDGIVLFFRGGIKRA
jgi:serine-type D-Ala-D-Ala carboxypeptidase (penicillin-binding protein 5/6)